MTLLFLWHYSPIISTILEVIWLYSYNNYTIKTSVIIAQG